MPDAARNGGVLTALENALQAGGATGPTQDGDWRVWTKTYRADSLLHLDGFGGVPGGGTPIEFRDPNIQIDIGLHQTGGTDDGGWRVVVTSPVVAVHLPFLSPARYDVAGARLVPDPTIDHVSMVVGGLKLQLSQLSGQSVQFDFLSASTTGNPADHVYDLVRMEPAYAIVGPQASLGFGFRAAVLDLSSTAGPTGLPAGARAMPDAWQGFYLPEVRVFVQPPGTEDLYVTAAARDLYIGVGASAGLTAIFEAEVVNAAELSVSAHVLTAAGTYIPVTIADPTSDPAHGTATVPADCTLFVDTHGGSGANDVTIAPGNATSVHGTRAQITTDAGGTTIQVTVVDGSAGLTKHLTITTSLDTSAAAGGGGGVTSLSVTPTGSPGPYRMTTSSIDPAVVRLVPEPPPTATIAWTSSTVAIVGPTDGASVTLDISALTAANPLSSDLTATVSGADATVSDCFFLFDHPKPAEMTSPGWALTPGNTRDQPSPAHDQQAASRSYVTAAHDLATYLDVSTVFTVDGYASYETEQTAYNQQLSQRRIDAAVAILHDAGFTHAVAGTAFGAGNAHTGTAPRTGTTPPVTPPPAPPAETDGFWWLARAWAPAAPPATVTATLAATREDFGGHNEQKDVTPAKPPQPSCFRRIGVRVEILRDTFIRAEIWGEFDLSQASDRSAPGLGLTAQQHQDNPADGIVDFLLRLRISEDRQSWEVDAEFRAHDRDKDGVYQRTRGDGIPNTVIDSVGALAVLAPLTAAASSLSPAAGGVIALGAVAVGAAGVLEAQVLTLHGGELVVADGIVSADGSTGDAAAGYRVAVFFDVETKFAFDLKIIRTAAGKPMSARYKAIGVEGAWGGAANPDFRPLAVFDPAKGYTIDAPDGSLVATPPLDQILRIFGFRVSRDNPMFVEVQFGIGLEIGILTIDTATVRAAFSGDGTPDISISRLSATLDVPGVLHGTGYVAISDTQISGGFDVSVTSVNIRIAATLTIHPDPSGGPAIGILFGAAVEFPAPILLGSSGLGIYGFLGGMGINFARSYDAAAELPALDWAIRHLHDDDLFTDQAWHYNRDDYSFGAGLVLGTVDGGFTLNLKGVLLISVPGPEITLLALANVLSPSLPELGGDTSATIVAVIDLDFGRGTVLVALRIQYDVGSLLSVTVPVTAFFDTRNTEHWYVELGNYAHPATVRVFDTITGTGYLEVHGDGIALPTNPPLSSDGLVFATGFHIEAVLMGSESIGLYFKAAAGFDALFAPDPLFIAGIFEVSGELRLWIISISASAKLDIIYRGATDELYVHGEVHGKVDFFFFSVEGSVELTIGSQPAAAPPPVQNLVTGVGLVNRTVHVLVEGTGVGEPVDGVIAKATEAAPFPADVPIDAIPVISFLTLPKTDAADVLGGVLGSYAGAPANPWMQLGDYWWRYEVTAVRLTGGPLIPPTPAGSSAASVWWVQTGGTQASSLRLALLNWTPDPHPAAVPYGEALTNTVDHRWGTICATAAAPAAVLWTFDGQPVGPSVTGWALTGIPWPDDPGTVRTAPVRTGMTVTELWRIAPAVDPLQGTDPAVVVGDAVACYDRGIRDPKTVPAAWAKGQPAGFSARGLLTGAAAFAALDANATAGGSLYDFPAAQQASAWEPATVSGFARAAGATRGQVVVKGAGCFGEVLRSPVRDLPEPAPGADDVTRGLVKESWSASGFRPDALADAVAFDVGGPGDADGFEEVGILMLLPRIGLEYGLVVSARVADGSEVVSHRVDPSDIVPSPATIPATWLEPGRPWADPVSRAGHLAARLMSTEKLVAVFVRVDGLGGKVPRVVVGWDRKRSQGPFPAFFVVAVEALLGSETRRADWDTTTLNQDQQALNTALTQPAGSEPLLTPDTQYTVEVDWQATFVAVSGDPHSPPQGVAPAATLMPSDLPGANTSATTQRFSFHTKARANVPSDVVTDLSPWVLSTIPAKEETGVFTHAGVSLTFSSQRVAALFDAYDLELYAVVHASSGIHPRLADQPDDPVPQVPLGGGSPYVVAGATSPVTSPWREAVEQVATEAGCLDASKFDHSTFTVTLPYVFEPLTEYLLDVHARKKGDAGTGDIVYRVPFRTGRFADAPDLAAFVGSARAEGRGILNPASLTPLVGEVSGVMIDDAFEAAGLGAAATPGFPAVQVLWSTDPVPQPIAVIVESSEQIVRSRPIPQQVPAAATDPDPTHHYWASVPWPWLTVAPSTGPADPGLPDAPVARIATGPGGTRAIAFLGAGARGTRLRLDLVSDPDGPGGAAGTPTALLSVPLIAAPWEEED
ncbi:hypothetical protein LK09_01015 [Microbacterium mangrovi]|uniref:OmpA-like domain-containing protein n=1 Tax=Microbacterium mangrovi TaxID=1348253 RepID=A0A0B2ADN6_9MICO|nr:hypothetical protein LK09_01015 [Microbacterium mangrovi]